jgi:hypothetical protein
MAGFSIDTPAGPWYAAHGKAATMLRPAAFVLVLAMVVPIALAQQPVPVGPQFQVNSFTLDFQDSPAVAADAAGNFVVVWRSTESSGSDTGSDSVQAQRYDSTGSALGIQFQVNSYEPNHQGHPAVAADSAGNFVVVWESVGSAGPDTDISIQAQRYDSTGATLGSEFQVNSYTTSSQRFPAVAADSLGNFVVTWQSGGSAGSDTGSYSIQAQRYDSTGAAVGSQFQVNSYTTGGQRAPAVADDGAGNVVVVWESSGSAGSDNASDSIQAQRYDSTGAAVGIQFQVNSYTTSVQRDPGVAADGAGNFVVVWESSGSAGSDASGTSIQAQRYDSTGAAVGIQFQVNSYTTSGQLYPAVAADVAGSFVVVWTTYPYGASYTGRVQAQRYDSAGAAVGSQFQVNSYTTGFNVLSAVAATGSGGNFVVTWANDESAGSDTSAFSIQGQRFAIPTTSTTSTTLPPTDLLPGRIVLIKPGTLAKFVAKPVTGDTFALPTANPIATGGSLRIFDLAATAGDDTYPLPVGTPPLGWKGLGSPAGSKGFKYKGAGSLSDPCKVVLVKQTVVKGVCKGTGITLEPPFTGDVGIVLSLGTTDRYCAQIGDDDEVRNDATMTKRKNAPAPGACP